MLHGSCKTFVKCSCILLLFFNEWPNIGVYKEQKAVKK
jgi:hypothetical protein